MHFSKTVAMTQRGELLPGVDFSLLVLPTCSMVGLLVPEIRSQVLAHYLTPSLTRLPSAQQ